MLWWEAHNEARETARKEAIAEAFPFLLVHPSGVSIEIHSGYSLVYLVKEECAMKSEYMRHVGYFLGEYLINDRQWSFRLPEKGRA